MSDLNLFLAENPDFKFVRARFKGASNYYTYKTTLNVTEGDFVVVDTPSNGFQVVEVLEALPADEFDLTYTGRIKWVVSRVDTEQYEETQRMEREANKKLNNLKAAKRRKEYLADTQEQLGEDGVAEIKKLVRL